MLSSLLALALTGSRPRRRGHDERLVVVVVLEVDLVHGLRHHDGNVVVPPLQIPGNFIFYLFTLICQRLREPTPPHKASFRCDVHTTSTETFTRH